MSATCEEPGDDLSQAGVSAGAAGAGPAACRPGRIPAGRWPADLQRPLTLSQQLAVNEVMARLRDTPGLLAVDGLPGTGKIPLLQDLIAAIVVSRAERLSGLASPAEAFAVGAPGRWQPGDRPAAAPLHPSLAGWEIVVASSGDRAVANVIAEISGPGAIGARWRGAAARLDYFTATARLVHGDGAWAMVAARLGDRDGCLPGVLGRLAGRPACWDAARDAFHAARDKVTVLADERAKAALAQARLTALRQDAATAYDMIMAAEEILRGLAGQRVGAERSLRSAWHQYWTLAAAREAHARAKPGLRAILATRFAAGREWRGRAAVIDSALRAEAAPVDAAQRAVAAIQARFAAAVRERGEAAAALRRLTAECAVAQAAVTRGRERWGGHFPCAPPGTNAETVGEPAAPWADEEFAAARTELFLAALALHKALITAQARQVRRNLSALAGFFGGAGAPDGRGLPGAWQTLFLVVPVIATTVASLPGTFGGLGPDHIGWLFIDEDGPAPPRRGAGEVFRARRTVLLGDPLP